MKIFSYNSETKQKVRVVATLLAKKPTFRLTVGAFVISFSGVWVKTAGVAPSSSAFYRVFFGFLFLLAFSRNSQQKLLPAKPHLLLGLFCGLLFALDLLCWHNSIRLIGPGLATLLGNFQVFILAAVGILFLKEAYTRLLLVAIPLAVAGLLLIVGFDFTAMGPDCKFGIIYGLATALFYAGYLLTLKHLASCTKETFSPMILVSFTTSIYIGAAMLVGGETFAIADLRSFVSLVSLGFFSQFFGWVCIASSLPQVKTSFAGLILLLQPALTFIWDVLFFARPTTPSNWIGAGITLVAIYLGVRAKS